MELERLSVRLRQRNPWEAIDLGFAMARQWWREVYGAWLVMFVVLAVVACVALPPTWALFSVWWLKPALDRIVLHVLAGAVFGSRPTLRETLRDLPRYAWNGLLLSLTLYRLSPVRSFTLPIRQLEKTRGAIARSRSKQLRRRASNQAGWLTLICLNFELVVFFSLVGLYDLLVPASTQESFDILNVFQSSQTDVRSYVIAVVYIAAMGIIEPLYVAGGFALYLNRRTQLEGWDLEVQLRRLAAPARPQRQSAAVLGSVLVMAFATLMTFSPGGLAQDAPPAHSAAPQKIKRILERPEFGRSEERWVIKPRNETPRQPPTQPQDMNGFLSFMSALAEAMRVLVWVALAAVLAFGLYWLFQRMQGRRPFARERWEPPQTLFGLDVRPEALPADVAAAARQLAANGNLVAALSLLYRGALASLLRRDHIQVASGDTEADCLAKTRTRIAPAAHAYLLQLLTAWQGAAYAHRLPSQPQVEALAEHWPQFFGTSA